MTLVEVLVGPVRTGREELVLVALADLLTAQQERAAVATFDQRLAQVASAEHRVLPAD